MSNCERSGPADDASREKATPVRFPSPIPPHGAAEPSMASLIEPHIPALRRFAWSLSRDGAAADDLVQDCLESAIAAWPQRRRDAPVTPWLMAIMHNLHVSRWRRWKRRGGDHLPLADWDAPVADDPHHRLEFLDVMAAMARLPEEQRSVLVLVGVEGLSYDATARVLGVPVGTVMSRLSRGRERLRRYVDGEPPLPSLRRVK